MLAINIKAESYIHEFNGRVRVPPPMIIYLPDSKSERSQKRAIEYILRILKTLTFFFKHEITGVLFKETNSHVFWRVVRN